MSEQTLDQAVVDAQQANIKRMSDLKLLDELRLVTGFGERPAIRIRYIQQLHDEIARRGLPA